MTPGMDIPCTEQARMHMNTGTDACTHGYMLGHPSEGLRTDFSGISMLMSLRRA